MEGISVISRFRAEKAEDGIRIDADLVLFYGYNIPDLLNKANKAVRNEIEKYTALNVNRITLTAKSLVMKKKETE